MSTHTQLYTSASRYAGCVDSRRISRSMSYAALRRAISTSIGATPDGFSSTASFFSMPIAPFLHLYFRGEPPAVKGAIMGVPIRARVDCVRMALPSLKSATHTPTHAYLHTCTHTYGIQLASCNVGPTPNLAVASDFILIATILVEHTRPDCVWDDAS